MAPVKLSDKKESIEDEFLDPPRREVGFRPTLYDTKGEYDVAQKGIVKAMIIPGIKNNLASSICAFLTLTALVGAGVVSGKKDALMSSYMLNFRIFFSCLTVASLGATSFSEEMEVENIKARKELKLLEAQRE